MTLLSPWWLLLLLPVALLAGVYVLQQRRRSQYAVRFASLPMLERLVPRRPGWRRHAPVVALLFAFALLALAAARPEMDVRVPRERATVIVTIDVSLSMKATDVEPNRLDAAAEAATTFVEDLPEGFDVGLVTFSGTTSVLSPPTAEREATVDALQDLDPVRTHGHRRGRLHLARAGEVDGAGRGRHACARPHRAALRRHQHHRPHPRGGRRRSRARPACPSRRSPTARRTASSRRRASSSRSRSTRRPSPPWPRTPTEAPTPPQSSDELDEVYDDIQSSIGCRTEPREITPYVSALALLIGLLAAALSLRWFARFP